PYETGRQTSLPLLQASGRIDPHKQNTLNDVLDHLRSAHTEEEDPMDCPISGDCLTNCRANGSLKNHVEHNRRGCDMQCSTRSSLRRHIKRKHKDEFLVCPKDSCAEDFKTLAAPKKHVETGRSNQFPCADEKCTKIFETQQKADDQNLDSRFCGQNFSGPHLEAPRKVTYS
ncbi:hypothetical protein FCULG_00007847, partial [Fusarium culmorum]